MPGDLNLKKSWNPALMKNQKKVWEREQQALKELQTIKQRQKEIAQEREKEEMIRLQYGSDPSSMPTKDKLQLNKLGWMYNEGPKDKAADESGLREVEEDFLAKSDEIQQLIRGNKAVKPTVSSRFDKVAAVGNSAPSRLLSDDPLAMIRREKFKQRSDRRDHSPERPRKDEYRGSGGKAQEGRSGYSSKGPHRYREDRNQDSYRNYPRDSRTNDNQSRGSYRDSPRDNYSKRNSPRDSYSKRESYRDSYRDRDSHRDGHRGSHRDSYRTDYTESRQESSGRRVGNIEWLDKKHLEERSAKHNRKESDEPGSESRSRNLHNEDLRDDENRLSSSQRDRSEILTRY